MQQYLIPLLSSSGVLIVLGLLVRYVFKGFWVSVLEPIVEAFVVKWWNSTAQKESLTVSMREFVENQTKRNDGIIRVEFDKDINSVKSSIDGLKAEMTEINKSLSEIKGALGIGNHHIKKD